MLTKYANRGKYFFTDPETGKTLHRDKMAERSIMRSYAFKRMEKALNKKKPPQDDKDFYRELGLPPIPSINTTAFDNAGREWKFTINGWEIIDGEYDPVLKVEKKLEVIVAHRPKHWLDSFDLTNKSHFPEYKWDWFEDNVSGDNVWGSMPGGDLDTGNPMGKNSIIYGSYQGDDFTLGGGGTRIPFLKHLPNALSYLKKGLRDVNDTMEQYNNLSGAFGSNSQMELDAMARDSVFQNEIIKFRLNSKDYLKHVVPPFWGGYNQPKPKPMFYSLEVHGKRKDSVKIVQFYIKRTDSIKKKWGLKD